MNHALTLRPPLTVHLPSPGRGWLVLALVATFLVASATSLAPTVSRAAGANGQTNVCKCAHCPGGLACCCRSKAGHCAGQ